MRNLRFEIEGLRQEMHEIVLKKGISHPDVLLASQRLDKAINEFHNKIARQTFLKGGTQSRGSKDTLSMIARLHQLLYVMLPGISISIC